MKMTRDELMRSLNDAYRSEYEELGAGGIEAILDRGRQWNLSALLNDGAVLVFPHVHIADCGPYTAAVVHACLDSGADRILVISVLHASSEEMELAKIRVATQETRPEEEPLRAIYGPGSTNTLDIWKRD